ncbi:hypothetical protein LQ327_01375 [Actinomycetospora endophytica]|uniref:Uncharacterized protein n=1 Tax=Actinomycetospora endophytica TaxID=2291215 RepID=A0ABS8P3Q4_9PSEU|nr:hypothetical protein [Actinomycetospora endophytica]MCD2192041.1 hypothetical protein [Actinomycetospora endophytica]
MAATEREIRNVWTNVCLVTHLSQVIPPPGPILQTPLVGAITLDSVPARFSVKLRPGQLPGDFAKQTERFAAAFRVPAVEVATLTQDNQWVSIRLMEPVWIEWPDEYVVEPAPIEEPAPALSDDTVEQPGDHAPVGGPRSLRHGRHRSTKQLRSGPEPSREPTPSTALSSVLRFLGDFWRLPDSDGTRPANR